MNGAAYKIAEAEAPLRPEQPIIDPHYHFWDDNPHVRHLGRSLPEDVEAVIAASGQPIAATVFVECRWHYRTDGPAELRCVGETEATERAAASAARSKGPALAAAIMGYADLLSGSAVGEVLDTHLAASPSRFRGVRFVTAADRDDPFTATMQGGVMLDPKLKDGVAELDRRRLIFETWCLHPQIHEFIELADAFPNVRMVLDHLATPIRVGRYQGREDQALAEWQAAIQEAARRPNVFIKIGGLGMPVAGYGWRGAPSTEETAAAYRPYVTHAIETFTPGRCLFESNFPVDGAAFGYGQLWNGFKLTIADLSAAEQHAMLFGTAADLYQLNLAHLPGAKDKGPDA